MHSIPAVEQLKFLIGLRISDIGINERTVTIRFQNSPVEISGYKKNFFIFKGDDDKRFSPDEACSDLFGGGITALFNKVKSLHIDFDNDLSLVLLADDEFFECFAISGPNEDFIV